MQRKEIDATIEHLYDLHTRLVLDYNGDVQFEQVEEDRLVVSNVIDFILLTKEQHT